jgi:DNA polymerase III epsilon subunit-like protein
VYGAAWFRRWVDRYGPFPRDYLIIDTETTGLSFGKDLVLQVGLCEVRKGKVVENHDVVLNWFAHPSISHMWLAQRIRETREQLQAQGCNYPWTVERVGHGEPPMEVLADYLARIMTRVDEGFLVLGHNIAGFDSFMLEAHFRRFLAEPYQFPETCWDTGAMEKASQAGWLPGANEQPFPFSRRVIRKPAKIKWSLERHSVPKYGLADKHKLDMTRAHTAGFDCLATHCLLEAFREMSEK